MNNNIAAIIFDLDGVLVFTDTLHYQAWKTMADKIGVYFDEAVNNRLRGVSRMESLEIILERHDGKLTDDEKAALAEEKNDSYRCLLEAMTPADVDTDTRDTLQRLRAKGYKLAIGSSSKNAGFILEKVQLTGMFDAISDGNNITHSKPDPEVFLKAAEFLGIAPEACAVVEDARSGIDAAKSAGMTAIAIGDACNYEKADYRISRLAEIFRIL